MRKLLCCFILLSLSTAACSGRSSSGAGEGYGEFTDDQLALYNQGRFGDGNIPEAQGQGLFPDIFFGYDSSIIPDEYYPAIKKSAATLSNDPSLQVEVEGHCDKRGTNEYNLALGEQRAQSVAKLLMSYGVSPSQVNTISYGEEIPLESGDSEGAYAKNRRVHFALFRVENPN